MKYQFEAARVFNTHGFLEHGTPGPGGRGHEGVGREGVCAAARVLMIDSESPGGMVAYVQHEVHPCRGPDSRPNALEL